MFVLGVRTSPAMVNEAQRLVRNGLAAGTLALALLAPGAQAAMRCGSHLIEEGDGKLEVLRRCGEPDLVEYRPAVVTARGPSPLLAFPGLPPGHAGRAPRVAVAVDVEDWTYNLGPARFMRRVRFANGRVVEIVSLGRGF